jgi:hypothetical protein
MNSPLAVIKAESQTDDAGAVPFLSTTYAAAALVIYFELCRKAGVPDFSPAS